jgi:tetraacyldisaccharide 4'-kinase
LEKCFPGKPVATCLHEPRDLIREDGEPESVEGLRGKNIAAVCGIGNPASFWKTLESLGANVVSAWNFPDHHGYTRADVDALREWVDKKGPDVVVTTQKDFVKLRFADLAGRPVRVVRIGLRFLSGETEFRAAIHGVL